MSSAEALKREAARHALGEVADGMVLGLGTGSTVAHFLEELAEHLRLGRVERVLGVPTSLWTAKRARELGIPLTSLAVHPVLDLAIDGTDEVDPGLDMIKGLGGALLREKMVAQAAQRLVVVADESKIVERLGEKAPLPVEVIRFGWEVHEHALHALGAHPTLRRYADKEPVTTDNGNYVLDCRFAGGIEDPAGVDAALAARAGVVETGLFLGMAHKVYVAGREGVRVLEGGR